VKRKKSEKEESDDDDKKKKGKGEKDKKEKGKKSDKSESEKEQSEEEAEEDDKKTSGKRKAKSQKGGSSKKKAKLDKTSIEPGQYLVEYAPSARASCVHTGCKGKIKNNELRIGRGNTNPHGGDSAMIKYYHVSCFKQALKRMRESTPKPESTDDLIGFDDLTKKDQTAVAGIFKK